MPYWSNIPKVAEFAFEGADNAYFKRASATRDRGERHAIVAGTNYGQGSSRESAAIASRYLGLQIVIAKSFARIHWQNLVNFGVLLLTFADPSDHDGVQPGDRIRIANVASIPTAGHEFAAELEGSGRSIKVCHTLSERQIEILMAGGAINWRRKRQGSAIEGAALAFLGGACPA
jgi:aconitate hydratase